MYQRIGKGAQRSALRLVDYVLAELCTCDPGDRQHWLYAYPTVLSSAAYIRPSVNSIYHSTSQSHVPSTPSFASALGTLGIYGLQLNTLGGATEESYARST